MAWAARNHRAMSARRAALSTTKARPATSAANHTLAPHWPGEIHTWPGTQSSSATIASPAGFQICLPSSRSTNLDRIATAPAAAWIHGSSARSSRLSDNPVMSGERRSIVPSRHAHEHKACAASALAIASALLSGRAPKSRQAKLKASRLASAAIWK